MAHIEKTNAIRILDRYKINYKDYYYGDGQAVSGDVIADILNKDPATVFKTLVTEGKSNANYVFVVPVLKELDLKKAAKAVREKSIAMIKQKELLPKTGYVHGGCSPIGMKKLFKTYIDCSALNFENIYFSAGKIGLQIETTLKNLQTIIPVTPTDITVQKNSPGE